MATSVPDYWFLRKNEEGKLGLGFEYNDEPRWQVGDTTEMDEKILAVFSPESFPDVVALLNSLYCLEEITGMDDWLFKSALEQIIRAAVETCTTK